MFSIFQDEQELSEQLSQELYSSIEKNSKLNLGLATGSTMLPIYKNFIKLNLEKPLELSNITTFNLDEYIGLDPKHPQSYNYFMYENLFKYLPGLDIKHTHLPLGICQDPEEQCSIYSDLIKNSGGIDIQFLGIGSNGHIGFNEPKTSFDSKTHIVKLTQKTRVDNGRFFDNLDEVPKEAITMGLSEIFEARKIYLVITGKHKAKILEKLYFSDISEDLPASILKKHPNVSIYIDKEAASLLSKEIQRELKFIKNKDVV